MATNGGGKIIRDGLVFGYDSGYGVANNSTPTKFYKGEPTTNLKSSTQTSGAINGMQGVGLTYVGEEDGYSKYSMSGTFSAGTYPYCMYLSPQQCLAGMRYSTQVIIKTNVRDKFNYFGSNGVSYVNQPKNHEGVNSSTLLSDGSQLLQRQGFEYTSTTTQAGYLWTNPINNTTFNPSTDFVYIKHFQIEQKIHCTPFVSDERVATKSLIDLTKPTDDFPISSLIYVGDISFDSTGQPTFDGTNDGINLGDQSNFDFTNGICSIEAIVKFPSTWTGGSQYPNLISKGASAGWDTNGWALFGFRDWGGKKSWGFGMRNGSTNRIVSRNNVAEDVFWHIVATLDGTTMRLYENGVEVSTNTQTINPAENTTNVYIGRGPSSQYFPGDLPVSKIYSRTLSPKQIEQNYKVYKNRFDL